MQFEVELVGVRLQLDNSSIGQQKIGHIPICKRGILRSSNGNGVHAVSKLFAELSYILWLIADSWEAQFKMLGEEVGVNEKIRREMKRTGTRYD